MKTFRLKYLYIIILCCTVTAFGQSEKLDKTYKTNADVLVKVNAKQTDIIIENWEKNEVEIAAYIEGENIGKEILDSWKLETSGTAGEVKITSGGGGAWAPDAPVPPMPPVNVPMAEMIGPLMNDLVAPLLENISRHPIPPLPPEFYENMGKFRFDYEAYEKEGDAYMKKFEEEIEKNFGEDFERSMEEWAAGFEANAGKWEKQMEAEMEAWGEKFGEDMEAWGESFGEEMEQWAEQFEKEMEAKENLEEGEHKVPSKAKKVIKIKMPKNGKLDLNVRHGEVKLAGRTVDLKADLSYSRLSANIIDGENTSIKTAYGPVKVAQWNYGVLNTSYAPQCVINNARSIKLTSSSSDVEIKKLTETGILSGSFGKLEIGGLSPGFQNLDIDLEHGELELSLPDAPVAFSYNGTQSQIEYPERASVKTSKSYGSEIINGYYGSKNNAEGNISIKASFSEVLVN